MRSEPYGAVAMTSAKAAHDALKSAGSAGRTVGPAGRAARRASPDRAADLNMAVVVRKAAAADTAADAGRAAAPATGSARARHAVPSRLLIHDALPRTAPGAVLSHSKDAPKTSEVCWGCH